MTISAPADSGLIPRALFDAVVDVSPDPVWVVDARGLLAACNRAFTRWIADSMHVSAAPGWELPEDQQVLRDLQRRALEGRAISADLHLIVAGVERMYVVDAEPVLSGARTTAAVFTAREAHAGGETAGGNAELALMHLFASDAPLPEVLAKTLEFLCRSDGWDASILWHVEDERLHAEAMWFSDEKARRELAPRLALRSFTRGHGVPGHAWDLQEVVWIPDLLEESMVRTELAAIGHLRSAVGVPLVEGERVTGVAEFFSRVVRPIDERTKSSLVRLATALSRLIERRRLLALIERRGAEWILTFDSIAMPIFLVGSDGRIARVNRAACAMTGKACEELTGSLLGDFGEGEPWKTLRDSASAVHDSGLTCTAQITKDESVWDLAASPLAGGGEEELRVIIALREISDIVRLQESVRRGEQLAALGELVAGVAHEVKNPLFGMGLTLDLLDDLIADRTDALELTGALRKWLARLQELTENLLAYGKTWTTDLKRGDVRDVVRRAVESCALRAADAHVALIAHEGDVEAPVLMDAARLLLVFENLLTNSVQYSSAGKSVYIDVHADGRVAEVVVTDEGAGFDPHDLPRVFQPFFTRRRGGTGLGLSIVQRIIEEHGGTVAAENAAKGGAVVRVRLPIYRHQSS